jgi:molybdopterin synthase catalytic subunit
MSYLKSGPISMREITGGSDSFDKGIGANAIFLGNIRNDTVDGKKVKEIVYSAYSEMAEKAFSKIEEEVTAKHLVKKITILHSIGTVKAGETSMLVSVFSKHRAAAFDALRESVERIKAEAPVWKKEIYEDESYVWVNSEVSPGCRNLPTSD